MIKDQLSVVEGLFSHVKGYRPLTEHFIRELQAQFTSYQDHVNGLDPGGAPVKGSAPERGL